MNWPNLDDYEIAEVIIVVGAISLIVAMWKGWLA
jgi:hypothetical protein